MRNSGWSDMPFFSNGIILALVGAIVLYAMGDGITSSWKNAGGSSVSPTKIASR